MDTDYDPENLSLKTFHEDFELLQELKAMVVKELKTLRERLSQKPDSVEDMDKEGRESVFRPLPKGNGTKYRRVYPMGIQKILQYLPLDEASTCSGCWFVGFFGTKQKDISAKAMDALWAMDDFLLRELPKHGVLAYVSSETVAGGEWYNLVLVEGDHVIDRFRDARGHDKAVSDISPKVYKRVRIHAGPLDDGVHGNEFQVNRTTFMQYEGGEQTKHFVHNWPVGDGKDNLITL